MVKIAGVTIRNTQLGKHAKSPLIGNVDGRQTPLTKVLGDKVLMSDEIDLSGGAIAAKPLFAADSDYKIVSAKAIYTEAPSDNDGIAISVGKLGDAEAFVEDTDTAEDKDLGYVQELPIELANVSENDVITYSSAGGKTGDGELVIQLVLQKA